MSTLMNEFDRVQRRRRRFGLLVALACLAGAGAWLTGPLGVVRVVSGNLAGWAFVALGVILLAAMVVSIVAAARGRVVPASLPGAANPRFDEPEPSRDPRGGNSWIGSWLGSR
jgi:uncharacterized protein (DUF58 family)